MYIYLRTPCATKKTSIDILVGLLVHANHSILLTEAAHKFLTFAVHITGWNLIVSNRPYQCKETWWNLP